MSEKYLIGVDAGTSVIKAVLFDLQGNERKVSALPMQASSPQASWVEQDMWDIWDKVKRCVRAAAAGAEPGSVLGIGLCAQGDGTWMMDAGGNPVRPGICWCDGRAGAIVERWNREGVSAEAFDRCGTAVFTGSQSTQVKWLEEHEPESLKRAAVIFHSKDWLFYKLTGRISTDETDESLPLLNMFTRRYDDELFRIFGLEAYRGKYPPVLASEENAAGLLPGAAAELGLPPGTLVAAGPMDVAACALGTGTIGNGQACSILGTAAIHEMAMDTPDIRPKMVGMTLCHAHKGKWLRMLAAMAATPNLDWFLKEFGAGLAQEAAEKGRDLFGHVNEVLLNIPAGAGGAMYHPYLFPGGERAPFVDPAARASFTGLAVNQTAGHLLRAVCEGVGFAMMDCYAHMPMEPLRINLSGGGAKSAAWCQIIADMMGKPVQIPSGSEFGAKGAALCAGVACGAYRGFEDAVARTVRYERQYGPDPANAARYRELYGLYKLTRTSIAETWEMRNRIA